MTFYDSLAYAYDSPTLNADFKLEVDDFLVEEKLGFEFSGSGEHVCALIEKTRLNTTDVVRILSRHCHVAPRDISFAGLKDKQAVTRQWFSLRVGAKQELDLSNLENPSIKVLDVTRNSRKIKRGSHQGNHFVIRLKNLTGDDKSLTKRSELVQSRGVPNYFGFQRFGKNQDNVNQALLMFSGEIKIKDRFLRGIYLSAARSYLFNQLLSSRVETRSWETYMPGDVMSLAGSASTFTPDEWDDTLSQRLLEYDIHPSGPLWGTGELRSSGETRGLEQELNNRYPQLCQGLETYGLKQERRALRLCPENLKINLEGDGSTRSLVIEFGLGKGEYATSVLRELITLN